MKPLFMTIFMARSGSKFLRSLLNQHPDIQDFGECFHERAKNYGDEGALFSKLGEIFLSPAQAKGIQFRYPRHFNEFPEIARLLEAHPEGVRFLHLKRRNPLKGAISQQNSEKLKKSTGKAHLFKASNLELRQKLLLDVPRAVKEAHDRARLDEEYLAWGRSLFDTHEVYYEDLTSDRERVVNGICRFLQMNPFKPDSLKESDLVKVTSEDLSEAIENYAELEQAVLAGGRPEWLAVEHPEAASLAATPPPAAAHRTPADRAVLVSCKEPLEAGGHVAIEARRLPLKTNAMFLEHFQDSQTGAQVVLASQDGVVLESRNDGRSWETFSTGLNAQKCFTTAGGQHLVQEKTGTVHLFSADWQKLVEAPAGAYSWHGSWSIDQCPQTGTLIWCEYPYCAETVNVWRSVDGGRSWAKCFSETGHPEDPKKGRIRHFHLVQKCTSRPGRWYLGSGDTEDQSRFWVSENDGETWLEVPLQRLEGAGKDDIPGRLQNKVYRFTGMVQTADTLVWATDDTFKGAGARLCIMRKDRLGSVQVAAGHCGFNEIRNFIQIDDRYAMAVSEAKLMQGAATLTVVDFLEGRIERHVALPNRRGTKSNFMNGVSSRKADSSGAFFARSDNIVLYPSPMTTAWKVTVRRPGAEN